MTETRFLVQIQKAGHWETIASDWTIEGARQELEQHAALDKLFVGFKKPIRRIIRCTIEQTFIEYQSSTDVQVGL